MILHPFARAGWFSLTVGVAAALTATPTTASAQNVPAPYDYSFRPALLTFSPDGRYLAAFGDKQSLGVWEVATGKRTADLGRYAKGGPTIQAFTFDNKTLAFVDRTDKTVKIFNVATGK